ncbi:MAG: UbiD family decarboxylase [Dehalococcoidia bacterium]|nr:UbiD family decarboxylase [Dehalococcoidia bacterium]
MNKPITSLRDALQKTEERGELLTVKREVDPIYEISGLQKALESGPAIVFDNIKGYPGIRDVGNIFARKERVAALFGLDDYKLVKFKCLDALKNPLPANIVETAPCQEVVITENIDVEKMLPIIKHSEDDGCRILGGGNVLVGEKYFGGGTELSFKRMHFRGKDWASIEIGIGSHIWDCCLEHRGQKIPVCVNIGTPPAVMAVSASMFIHAIVPRGSNEIGFAGALQGQPVDLVKAKTVDAYAVAQSEWVLEGYIDTTERVWETDEGDQAGKGGVAPVMPEWPGYLGRDYRGFKFQVTAITHRKDRPIFFTPLAHGFEGDITGSPFREACFIELAQRVAPGLVQDAHILPGVAGWGSHIIYQVTKRRGGDEGYQRNILGAALGTALGLRLAVVVDEDIDIYSADDVLWAIITRVSPDTDILRGSKGGVGYPMVPAERQAAAVEGKFGYYYEGGMGMDATAPYRAKDVFTRAKYPVSRIKLNEWLTPEEIVRCQALQSEYGKVLARLGG